VLYFVGVPYFIRFIIAKLFSDLSLLDIEIDSHSQFEVSKFFLRTSFVRIPSYWEAIGNEEVNFEAFDKQNFLLPDR
jgi:hypothetical protein